MSARTKYIVWIRCNHDDAGRLIPKEERIWEEQGDGPLTEKQAVRIAAEIAHDFGVRTRIRAVGSGAPLTPYSP